MLSIKEKLNNLDEIAQKRALRQSDYFNCQLASNYPACQQKIYFRTKKPNNPPIPRRFNDLQVRAIRCLAKSGYSHAQLAALFATCKATIWHVVTCKGAYADIGRN